MKPEAQRIAIAEACGWKRDDSLFTRSQGWRGPQGQWYSPLPPDYLNSLDAMHEAEKVLDRLSPIMTPGVSMSDPNEVYEDYLSGICNSPIRADAAQRAEAFLKTLSLWTDES